jgi:hypothetical protein
MGIFVTPPSTSEPTFAVGASTGAMRFGQLPSFALGGAVATSTATATSPLVCSGDSGGPIMQRPLVDDIPMPLFFGTAVGMPAPPPGTPSETCPPPGTTELWWRVDGRGKGNGEIDFISEQVEKWIGHCHDVPIPGGTALQCWGESCRGDADCGASEYCSAPASDYTGQCPICADSTQGCDCIEGQCLPQPKFTN